MKYNKMFAVAIAALLCVGSIPFLLDTDNSVSGDSVLELEQGDAWGQVIELDYDLLKPGIGTLIDSFFDEEIALYQSYLDDPLLSDEDRERYTEQIEIMGEMKEQVGGDPEKFISFFIGYGFGLECEVSADLDFVEAILLEVTEVSPDGGYTVGFEVGLGLNLTGSILAEGHFDWVINEGDYAVPLDLDVFLNLIAYGEIEFLPTGAVKRILLNLDLQTEMSIDSTLGIIEDYDEINDYTNMEFIVFEEMQNYNLTAWLKVSVEVSFSDDGLFIIPFTLDGTTYDGVTEYETTFSIDMIDITGKITVSEDAEQMLNAVANVFNLCNLLGIDEELGFIQGILNYKLLGIIKITDDGEVVINKALEAVDLNGLLETLLEIDRTMIYTVEVTGNDDIGYDIEIQGGIGTYLEGFLWNSFIEQLNELDLITEFAGSEVMDYINEMFGEDIANSLVITDLDSGEKKYIRDILDSLKIPGNDDKQTDGDEDGDLNIMPYIWVTAGIVTIIALLSLFYRKA